MKRNFPSRLLPALLLVCTSFLSVPILQAQERIEEVVVIGKRPGPPLWRVTNGANTLWILPLVSAVPKDMIWDDTRVAALIMDADEAITPPDVSLGTPKRLLLNPLNLVRGYRLIKRLSRNPDGTTLAEVLPHDLHERYAALKNAYFPQDRSIDLLRPAFASSEVRRQVLEGEQLARSSVIQRQVEKHLRRNHKLVRTDVSLEQVLEGSYGDISQRVEAMVGSLPLEQEIVCFDQQMNSLQRQHLDEMKRAANAWATGSARGLKDSLQAASEGASCSSLLLGSPEGQLVQQLLDESRRLWLDAAAVALGRNRSTFAMLPLNHVTGPDSLVDQLARQGYAVHAPL